MSSYRLPNSERRRNTGSTRLGWLCRFFMDPIMTSTATPTRYTSVQETSHPNSESPRKPACLTRSSNEASFELGETFMYRKEATGLLHRPLSWYRYSLVV